MTVPITEDLNVIKQRIQNLLLFISKALVDANDEVTVELKGESSIILAQIRAPRVERGKLIGRQGKTIEAIRTIVSGTAQKSGIRAYVEILEDDF